jgi:hypothetical protein
MSSIPIIPSHESRESLFLETLAASFRAETEAANRAGCSLSILSRERRLFWLAYDLGRRDRTEAIKVAGRCGAIGWNALTGTSFAACSLSKGHAGEHASGANAEGGR